jgi:hypothetical protein
MYYLYHINGLNYIEMRDGMSFGRNNGSKTFPDDHKMSGEHCRFKVAGDEVFVEDLGSKNRTSLDRIEIHPNKPTQMYLMGVLELGQQRFIMTDHNLTLQEVNEILGNQQGLQIARLEGAKIIQEKNNRLVLELEQLQDSHQKINAELIDKKFKLADAKKNIINLAKETETELKKLDLELKKIDEEKARVLNAVVEKEDQLQMMIKTLNNDSETLGIQLEKLREEIESKKKKLKK